MKTIPVFACLLAAFSLCGEELPRYRWENFTAASGLPDDRVYSVCVDGDRIWAGTNNGLALYERGKWKQFTTADGLAHRAVLSLAIDKQTHDLWIATMGGLSRYSAGRLDTFTQLNSGLPNDVVLPRIPGLSVTCSGYPIFRAPAPFPVMVFCTELGQGRLRGTTPRAGNG